MAVSQVVLCRHVFMVGENNF